MAKEAICLLDNRGVIVDINKAMLKELHYPKSDLVGKIYTELLTDELLYKKHIIHAVSYPHQEIAYSHQLNTQKGTTITFEARAKADEEGNICLIGVFQMSSELLDRFDNVYEKVEYLRAVLEVSERRRVFLDTVLATLPDGIALIDRRGVIRSINSAAEQMFGFKDIDVFDKSVQILLAEQPIPEHISDIIVKNDDITRTIHNVELVGKKKSGIEFPIGVSISEAIVEGKKSIFVVLVRDLSKEKEVEKTLQSTQQFGLSIFDSAKIGLAVINEWGYFTHINKSYAAMIDYQPEELLGKLYSIIVPDFEFEQAIQTIKNARRGNTKSKQHWKLKRKDGSLIDIELNINDFYDKDGKQFFILSSKDITHEKKTRKDLVRTKELVESIFQSLDNVFWSYDLVEQKLLTISAAAEQMYGVSAEQLIDSDLLWLESIHPDDRERVKRNRDLAREGKTSSYEYRIKKPNGSIRWIQTDTKLLTDKNGKPIRVEGVDTDVTERTLALQELDETSRMLQFILSSLPNGVVFTNTDLEIEWINETVTDLLGINEEECIGRKFNEFFVKDSLFLLSENFDTQKESSLFELTLHSSSGEYIHTETITKPVYNKKQETIGFLYVIRDIRKRIELEEEKTRINHSLAQFKHTLDVTKDSVFMFSVDTQKFIYTNKGASESTGYSSEELSKMSLPDLMSDTDLKDFEHLISYLASNTNDQITFDTNFVHKSGGKFPAEVLMQYVDLGEKESRFVAIVRDISERKVTEQLLQESELKFRSTFEQAGIGIAHIGIDLSWAAFNQHFCEIIGYESHELSVRKLRETTHPKDLPRDIAYLKQVLEGKSDGYTMRTRYIHKNGSTIWLNLSLSVVMDDDDKPAFMVMFVENISDQVESEEVLRDTLEQLKLRNYELDQFVYKASHDLRSPLTSILGLLGVAEKDPKNALKYVSLIRGRILKLDEFVRSIIHYSQTSNLESQYEIIEIERLVHKNVAELDYLPYADSIRFKIENKNSFPIYSDYARLNVIVRNLLSNAIKFLDTNKKTSYIIIEASASKKDFFVSITDNGVGIDAEYQSRIFEMFYRGHERSDGNGLGLYIVRQAVEKLGGNIKFSSTLGKGSSFFVSLPNHIPEEILLYY